MLLARLKPKRKSVNPPLVVDFSQKKLTINKACLLKKGVVEIFE